LYFEPGGVLYGVVETPDADGRCYLGWCFRSWLRATRLDL